MDGLYHITTRLFRSAFIEMEKPVPGVRNFFGGHDHGFLLIFMTPVERPVERGVCVRNVCGCASSRGVKTFVTELEERRRKRDGRRRGQEIAIFTWGRCGYIVVIRIGHV